MIGRRHGCAKDDRRIALGAGRRRASRRRRHRLAAARLQPRPAGLCPARRLRAARGQPHPRRRWQAARRIRQGKTGLRAGFRHAPAGDRCLRLGRGQDLLRASGDRSPGNRGRADQESYPDRHRPAARRGVHHHPAGDEELPADRRGVLPAQGARDPARLPDREGAVEAAHPRALPQPDLSGAGLVWRRGRRHQLFQQVARRAHRRRGRVSRRPSPRRPTTTTPGAGPRRRAPGGTT